MSINLDDQIQLFIDEAGELLQTSEDALLRLEDQPDDEAVINDLFCAFHTVKGSAGVFGLAPIVEFTHVVESVLDRVRNHETKVTPELADLFLRARDQLSSLVDACAAGQLADATLAAASQALMGELDVYLGKGAPASAPAAGGDVADSASDTTADQAMSADAVVNDHWHISLRFGKDAFRNGMEPASFLRYLANLGELESVQLVEDGLPAWNDLDPESCHLGFEVRLAAQTTKAAIEEVFEFVQDDCELYILPPHSSVDEYVKLIEALDSEPRRIGEILVGVGALTENELRQALGEQDAAADDLTGIADKAPALGEVVVEHQAVEQEVVDAAVSKQEAARAVNPASQSVRVNSGKLEQLINLVGELVIGAASADLNARRLEDLELIEAMENMSRLVEDIRDTTLGLRMVQIGETFNRFKRVVRETARDLGKSIDLRISGAETELDKTVVEKIGDPLMHLVRNAIDHGIEASDVRLAAGKSATGTVRLDAFHDSGSIVIQISDDGGGLNKDKIFASAVNKGLIAPTQQLSDSEMYKLIFMPGFSTAAAVTNISGRGVGMDVVKRNIDALRGLIDVESELGKGTTFTVRLPLTLAIIDGFQIGIGQSDYIIPLDMVEECVELSPEAAAQTAESHYMKLRGKILPFVRLREMFHTEGEAALRQNVVVVSYGGERIGLVVDELKGEHQTVIKPLGKIFQHLSGISGATILGSGEVALIVDVPGLVRHVTEKFGRAHARSGVAKV